MNICPPWHHKHTYSQTQNKGTRHALWASSQYDDYNPIWSPSSDPFHGHDFQSQFKIPFFTITLFCTFSNISSHFSVGFIPQNSKHKHLSNNPPPSAAVSAALTVHIPFLHHKFIVLFPVMMQSNKITNNVPEFEESTLSASKWYTYCRGSDHDHNPPNTREFQW